MPLLPKLASLYRSLFRRADLDRDLDDELDGYVDALTEKKIRQGADPSSARRAAINETGIPHVRQEVRSGRMGHGIEVTVQDVRHAWRGLRRSPGFAVIVLATLALGIGANVAVFSVVNAILVRPLPFRDAHRLVIVWSDMTAAGYPRAPLSGPELDDLRRRTHLFTGFGAIWSNTAALTGDGDPEQLRIGFVTSDFFSVLGAEPLLGRTFRADDDTPGAPATIVLSWPIWQGRYGGDRSIIGRRVIINGAPATVVGVMPAGFRLFMPADASVPDDLQAWLPFNRGIVAGPRGQQYLRVIGRMRPDVSVEAARADVTQVAQQISHAFPEYGTDGRIFRVIGLQSDDVRGIRGPLLALFTGVVILLLIACVNVAALLVARASARRHETALRMALGAGRNRLVRQCLAEGLLLAVFGGIGSAAVGRAGLKVLLALRPQALDRIATARMDTTVLLFAGATALLWGTLCALAPLTDMWRTDLTSVLSNDGRATSGRARTRFRAGLVVVQLAFSLVLFVSAGLLARSFVNLLNVDPGFHARNVLTFRLALPFQRYRTPDARNVFARNLETRLGALPGVAYVGAISHLPYDDLPNWGGPYLRPGDDASRAPMADYRAVSPNLFKAIGAQLVEGRLLAESDERSHSLVVIVDDVLAARAWPGQSALGKTLILDPGSSGRPTVPATVVGVVRHLRLRSLIGPLSEQVFFAERQVIRNPVAYVVAASDRANLAGAIRAVISGIDPQLPIYDMRPLDDYVSAAQSARRFVMLLAAAFAALAAALASIGVYGVMAYSVTRRRREFGVRLAMGARPGQVMRLVIRDGAMLTSAGLVAGMAVMLAAGRPLQGQLFGVSWRDASTYLAAGLLLWVCALAASWIPARRATLISPIEVLRGE